MQETNRWSVLGWLIAAGLTAWGCSAASGDDLVPPDARDVRDGTDGDVTGPPLPDADGDTIADTHEGRSANVDTDSDTTPDYLDDDSDGDGIPDAEEAGDGDTRTEPADTDGDDTPNFRDDDSDGNGILDAADGRGDLDGDGLADFMDRDDDGDLIEDVVELAGNPALPVDTDADTLPDYHDIDSDTDTISDREEATSDVDGDTTPDRFDLDSDNDTWTDTEEAGDENVTTAAVDTDHDTVADFRDPDSDGDGLADDLERTGDPVRGVPPTSRTDPDTDDDDVNDMIEYAAGTDPTNPDDNPRTRGDFVFTVPYNDPATHPVPDGWLEPDPPDDTLIFSTNIQIADVYFLVDCTGSMYGEIDNLKASISATVIPGLRLAIPDVWIGVGHHDDVRLGAYGGGSDMGYENLQNLTVDVAAAQTAANALPRRSGADYPESPIVAFWAIATGDGSRTVPVLPAASCGAGTWGYPCFREGAVPIIIEITDATMHNGPPGTTASTYSGFPAPTYEESMAALNERSIRVIGVSSGGTAPRHDLEAVAIATGAVDIGGTPLVYDIPADGSGLGAQVITAVQTLATSVALRIDAVPVDDPSDTVDAPVEFIAYIEANASGETITDPVTGVERVCTVTDPLPVDETGDGHADYFPRVLPGTPVCFDIIPKRNMTVPATREPQMFKATIQVQGDRITILDERDVFFLVPPEIGIIIG